MLKKKVAALVAACALALTLPTAAFAASDWGVAATGDMGAIYTTVNSVTDTTTDGYLYRATVNVTVDAGQQGQIHVSAPRSAVGEMVTMSGYATGSVEIIDHGFSASATLKNIPAGTGTLYISVVDPDYVAPVTPPPDGTDPADPADTPAADDNADKATDESKTSPQTGVDSSSVAFAGMGSLIAAGCVAFAIRKKAISEK